jgi:hypothetical protein
MTESEKRRRRFWFDDPWHKADETQRLRAIEFAEQIIFCDRSAVRFDGVSWVKDDRYLIEGSKNTEADRFLEERTDVAKREVDEAD